MKGLLMGLIAASLLLAGTALAEGENTGSLKVLRKPILMDYGASPLLAVTFNHSSHKKIKCVLCHHMETSDGKRYVNCTNEECHSTPGARERDPMSMFMAYHDSNTDRSCYGCHKMESAKYPEFKGCRPCHMPPQARKTASK